MSTSLEFQLPAHQATKANGWLKKNTKNIVLEKNYHTSGQIRVYSQADLDWCETDECPDQTYFREYFTKRQGKCEWQLLSGMEESDYALVADILCELNEKFDVKYHFNIFGEDECDWYFNKEQQQRITNNGERLYIDIENYEDEAEMLKRTRSITNFLTGKTWEEINGINPEPSESKERALSLHVEFTKNNENFYPTPKSLAQHMLSKIDYGRKIKMVLEPSAGKGDLISAMEDYTQTTKRGHDYSPLKHGVKFMAIEKDRELMANLMGKRIDVIDSDFLYYNGLEQFDLIVMNPPFDEGEKHLHKALDIMFTGQIVCLLNAKTIKNPYSNERKRLVQRLKELKAEIEYIDDAFNDTDSQRKTDVETALIYINIQADVETNIFSGMREEGDIQVEEISENFEVATFNEISNLVLQYNRERELVNNQIMDFYKNHKHVGKYLSLRVGPNEENKYSYQDETLTETMKRKLNEFNEVIKKRYWYSAIQLKEIQNRVTAPNRDKINSIIGQFAKMEFSESNIRQLIINVIEEYPKMIQQSIQWMFTEMTKYALKDSRWDAVCITNIHYFNGWKTNRGYIVNDKVIIPWFHVDWSSRSYRVSSQQTSFLDDLHKIMTYFEGNIESGNTGYLVNEAVCAGNNTKIDTKFFEISVYKKGTIHFRFKDKDLLRRFNIEACKGKEWLPMDYSEKSWESMDDEEREVAESFEGSIKNYKHIYYGILRLGPTPLLNLLPSAQQDEVEIAPKMHVDEVEQTIINNQESTVDTKESNEDIMISMSPALEAQLKPMQMSLFDDAA